MRQPTLLVVDDAPEMGLFVRHLGKRAGQRVEHCLDGESAWDLLTANPLAGERWPDLILLDLNLPLLTGQDWWPRVGSVP